MVVIVTVVTVVVRVTSFSKNNLTPRQPMKYSQGSFLQFLRCFQQTKLRQAQFRPALDQLTQIE